MARKSLLQRNYVAAAKNISAAYYRRWRDGRRNTANAQRPTDRATGTHMANSPNNAGLAATVEEMRKELKTLQFRHNRLKENMIERDQLILELLKEQKNKAPK